MSESSSRNDAVSDVIDESTSNIDSFSKTKYQHSKANFFNPKATNTST